MYNNELKLGWFIGVMVILASCAQSPQKVELAPRFEVPDAPRANGQPVHVRVSDQRAKKVLGSRGGAYPETSVITLANDLSSAVTPAVKEHLQALGYNVDSLDANTVDLHIIFDSLVYHHPEDDGVGHDMDMEAEVRVEASRNNQSYNGRYRVKRQQKFFNAPSDTQNSELINALVVEVLENMLADQKLQEFLNGASPV